LAGALEGIRIIDATGLFAGPLATMTLGDQGADVIKIEPPGGRGDLLRKMGILHAGVAATFHAVNRNKRSLVLDLGDERGAAILQRLVAGADVFVHSFRPGVAERLGIDDAALRGIQPDLIHVSLTGWGETGPLAGRPAFDSIMQAASGIAASQAGPDGRPELVRNALVDKVSGLNLAQSITAALFARSRTGEGQHVELNMLDAAVAFLWLDVMQHRTFVGHEVEDRNAWMRLVRTRDGWVILSLNSDAAFSAAVEVLGDPSLGEDPRFQTVHARGTALDALSEAVEQRTLQWETAALCERLAAADVPHAPVTGLDEIETHPQVQANETLTESEHPTLGRVRHTRPVTRFAGTPSSVRRLAPELGEHSEEILAELGFEPAETRELIEAGIVEASDRASGDDAKPRR